MQCKFSIPQFFFFFFVLFFFLVVLGTEPRASHMLGKCSTTELHSQTYLLSTFYFEIGAYKVVQAGLQLDILLPLPPKKPGLSKVINTNKWQRLSILSMFWIILVGYKFNFILPIGFQWKQWYWKKERST